MVFAPVLIAVGSYRESSGQFYYYMTNPAPLIWTTLSGQLHRDKTLTFCKRTFAKTHANPDADSTSLNQRAVRFHLFGPSEQIDYQKC
jgi:hypothetical protein